MLRRPSQPLRPDIPGTTTTPSLGSYDLYAKQNIPFTSHWLSFRYIVHWISSQKQVVLAAVFESAAGVRHTPLTHHLALHRIKGRIDIHSFLLIHRQHRLLFWSLAFSPSRTALSSLIRSRARIGARSRGAPTLATTFNGKCVLYRSKAGKLPVTTRPLHHAEERRSERLPATIYATPTPNRPPL